MFLVADKLFRMWWPGTESNRRRQPFQGRYANAATCLESVLVIQFRIVRALAFVTAPATVGCFGLPSVRYLYTVEP